MGLIKSLFYTGLTVAVVGTSAYVGYSMASDETYRVNREGNIVMLENKETKNAYPIAEVNGQTIIADLDNNLVAIQYLAKQEMSSGVKKLKDVSSNLDNMLEDGKKAVKDIVDKIKTKTTNWRVSERKS